MKRERQCPRCHYQSGKGSGPYFGFEFGHSAQGDVLFLASAMRKRWERSQAREEEVLARLIDGIWLAFRRADERALAELSAITDKVLANERAEDETWFQQNADDLDNVSVMEHLLMLAEGVIRADAVAQNSQIRRLVADVAKLFPWLPDAHRRAKRAEIESAIAAKLARPLRLEADRIVAIALGCAGMASADVHGRLSFYRARRMRKEKKAGS